MDWETAILDLGKGRQRLRQALVGGVSHASGQGQVRPLVQPFLSFFPLFPPFSISVSPSPPGHWGLQRPRSGSPEGQLCACQLLGVGLALRKEARDLGEEGAESRAGSPPPPVCLSESSRLLQWGQAQGTHLSQLPSIWSFWCLPARADQLVCLSLCLRDPIEHKIGNCRFEVGDISSGGGAGKIQGLGGETEGGGPLCSCFPATPPQCPSQKPGQVSSEFLLSRGPPAPPCFMANTLALTFAHRLSSHRG